MCVGPGLTVTSLARSGILQDCRDERSVVPLQTGGLEVRAEEAGWPVFTICNCRGRQQSSAVKHYPAHLERGDDISPSRLHG